jgi:HPt (histidine-containing phosphotransfer) domain-containing protein
MTQKKKKKPRVVSYKDHMLITPPNTLEDRVVETGDLIDETAALRRAEAGLAALTDEFHDWMAIECERLEDMRRALRGNITTDNLARLFRAAHDIKSEAVTFGYPLAADAAASLCRLLTDAKDPLSVPLLLIDQHVDAVRAIIREADEAFAEEIAEALAGELESLTEAFLGSEEQPVLSRLEQVPSPPTAPDGESV